MNTGSNDESIEMDQSQKRRGLDAPALTTQQDVDGYSREEDRKDRDQAHFHRRFWVQQSFFAGFFTVGVLIAVFNQGDLRSIGAGWAGSILGAFIQREASTKSTDKKDS